MEPRPWPVDPIPELAHRAGRRPAIVLDDDPTGTQTLRDVTVLTSWDAAAIRRHLADPVIFVSTNSRSVDAATASDRNRSAVAAALEAAAPEARPLSFVSRGDSTLRGHFVAETRAVAAAIGEPDARILLAPYFGEGGRLTIDDTHVVESDGLRRPVAETEFARDPIFGYRSSNLREWVAEQYAAAGRPAPETASLSLHLVRSGGPEAVASALRAAPPGGVVIANAQVERDIEVVALGAMLAEEAGTPIVARTAASYVRARAGRSPAPLLRQGEAGGGPAGLIVVGSHVETTTRQLEALLGQTEPDAITMCELDVADLIAGRVDLTRVADTLTNGLAVGNVAIVSTERVRRDGDLGHGRAISEGLVEVVQRVSRRPDWVIAKGGITSSDVASIGLGMRESRVAGQVLPGVPVWIGGAESRWPGMPLVVFPGNVGGPTALADVVERLRTPATPGDRRA